MSLSPARCFITQKNPFLQFRVCCLPSKYVLEKLWKIKVRKMLSWRRDATNFQFSDADSDIFEEVVERRRETGKSVKKVRDRLRSLRNYKNPLLGMAGYFCLFVGT